MNDTDITPALTAEEWAAFFAGAYRGLRTDHAVAALHLHGQPFGFTWDDVDSLINAAHVADNEDGGDGSSESFARLTEIANRIAALLPPRE